MAVTGKIKILDRKIKQNEAEKPLKYLLCLLQNWINMSI